MCVLAVNPAKVKPKAEYLENCYKNNRDGCGIAYMSDGKVTIDKGLWEMDDFIDRVHAVPEESAMLIHCRIATTGDVVSTDSESYGRAVLGKMIRELIGRDIGAGNKMALLTPQGNAYIINKKSGEEAGGVWYSNSSYKQRPSAFRYWDMHERIFGPSRNLLQDPLGLKAEDYNTPEFTYYERRAYVHELKTLYMGASNRFMLRDDELAEVVFDCCDYPCSMTCQYCERPKEECAAVELLNQNDKVPL